MVISPTKGTSTLRFNQIIRTPNGHLGAVYYGQLCDMNWALASGWVGPSMPLNRSHQIMGHAHDRTSMLTAKYYNIKVTGTLEPCEDCKLSKARQKNVTKLSEGTATAPLCGYIISKGYKLWWKQVLDISVG